MKIQVSKSIETDGRIYKECLVVVFDADGPFFAMPGQPSGDEMEIRLAEKRAARLLLALAEPKVPTSAPSAPSV